MTNRNLSKKLFFAGLNAALMISLLPPAIFAQTKLPAPRQETLLNGLKVLMWADPGAKDVAVKIRIHSGSAFDPQGREGVMKLLAESIFPNSAAREFFTEDLGGSLEIVTTYDYIQVNASSKPDSFLTMLETLSAAVSNPAIDKETTAKVRDALLPKVKAMEADPAYVADKAVAKRLFGTFPYGRPEFGTTESLRKIDFADLLDAKKRFLTADNATVTITGNFDNKLGFRAVRRYFGGWLKSDKRVPSTFRQPDEPDTKPLLVAVSGTQRTQVRYAFRGVARNSSDFAAAKILARILFDRLLRAEPKDSPNMDFVVRHDSHVLPGYLVFSHTFIYRPRIVTNPTTEGGSFTTPSGLPDGSMGKFIMLISKGIAPEEFSSAKSAFANENNARPVEEWWLDLDTFKTLAVNDEIQALQKVSQADVQLVADKLAKNQVVTVIVHGIGEGDAAKKN